MQATGGITWTISRFYEKYFFQRKKTFKNSQVNIKENSVLMVAHDGKNTT